MIQYSHPPHTMIVQKLNLYLFSSFLSVSDLVIGLQPSAIDQCLSGKMDGAVVHRSFQFSHGWQHRISSLIFFQESSAFCGYR